MGGVYTFGSSTVPGTTTFRDTDLIGNPQENCRTVLNGRHVDEGGNTETPGTTCEFNGQTAAPATVSVAPGPSLAEGNGGVNTPKLATFEVTRTGSLSGAATVRFRTESGTSGSRAISEKDFKAWDTLVQLPAGVATAKVTVKIVGDRLKEPNETFRAVLSAPSSGLQITDGVTLATIVNHD